MTIAGYPMAFILLLFAAGCGIDTTDPTAEASSEEAATARSLRGCGQGDASGGGCDSSEDAQTSTTSEREPQSVGLHAIGVRGGIIAN
jgi:hypothetical protein